MKQKHILFGLFALLGASCSDRDMEATYTGEGQVKVTAGIANSRVGFNEMDSITYAYWQDGDVITLSTSLQGSLDYAASVLSEGDATTVTFSPQGTSLKDIDGETVYACYPAADITDGKVSLPVTNVWSDNQPMPFAYAVSGIQNSEVNLQFKHIFSFLKFTVTPDMLTDKTQTISQLVVSTSSDVPLSTGEGDTFDFSTLKATTTNGSNSVQIKTNASVLDSDWTVYVPVLPQPAGVDITITLKDSEGGTLYTLTKESPATGFLTGNVYRVGTMVSFDTSYLIDGPTFNASIKGLVNDVVAGRGVDDSDSLIAKIEFLTEVPSLPESYITISAEDSPAPIYATFNAIDSLLTVFTPARNIEVVDASNMFSQLKSLRVVDFGAFGINETTKNTSWMFYGCISLASLNVVNWNTVNVTSMRSMFENCFALSSLSVSDWKTENVTDMRGMFYGCSAMTALDVANWMTANVTDMAYMFEYCSNLTGLDTSNWNTEKVTNMEAMFCDCYKLVDLDVSNWNTTNVTSMYAMFEDCSALSTLDVSNWNTANVTDMSYLFLECSSLTTLDVSNWDTGKVTNMLSLFSNCSALASLDVSNWNTANVTDMRGMFNFCSSLTSLDVSNWNIGNVTQMIAMFQYCSSLTLLDVADWNMEKVTRITGMFNGCSMLTTLDVSKWNISNATDISAAFTSCSALTSLDVSNWNTANVTDMSQVFDQCENLNTLDISNWNTSNVTNMNSMFRSCYELATLDVSSWDTSKVIDMDQMFGWCHSLTSLDLSQWDVSNVTGMYEMFVQCTSITFLNLSDWDISKLNNIQLLFRDCFGLTKLDISNWVLNESLDYTEMFTNCAATSQSCEITATQEAQDFLLSITETTGMNSTWFIWTNGKTEGGSSVENMPNQGW